MTYDDYQEKVRKASEFQSTLSDVKKAIPNNISQSKADMIAPPIKKGELDDVKGIMSNQNLLDAAIKKRFGDNIPDPVREPIIATLPKVPQPTIRDVANALIPFFKYETLKTALSLIENKRDFHVSGRNESLVGDAGTGKTTQMIVSIMLHVSNGHGLYVGKEFIFKSYNGKKPVLLLRWYDGMTDPIFWQDDVYNKGLSDFYKNRSFSMVFIDDFMQNIGDDRTKSKFISLDSFRYLIDFVFSQHDMGAKFFITANATSRDGYVQLFDIFSNSFFERVGTTKPVIDLFDIPSYREV